MKYGLQSQPTVFVWFYASCCMTSDRTRPLTCIIYLISANNYCVIKYFHQSTRRSIDQYLLSDHTFCTECMWRYKPITTPPGHISVLRALGYLYGCRHLLNSCNLLSIFIFFLFAQQFIHWCSYSLWWKHELIATRLRKADIREKIKHCWCFISKLGHFWGTDQRMSLSTVYMISGKCNKTINHFLKKDFVEAVNISLSDTFGFEWLDETVIIGTKLIPLKCRSRGVYVCVSRDIFVNELTRRSVWVSHVFVRSYLFRRFLFTWNTWHWWSDFWG